jgi:hypothetical protein
MFVDVQGPKGIRDGDLRVHSFGPEPADSARSCGPDNILDNKTSSN